MKKKWLVLAVVTALVLSMAGCAASAEDYEDDMETFLDMSDLDMSSPEDMKDDFKDYKFVTKEGKAFKKAFSELLDVTVEAYELNEKYDDDKISEKKFDKKMDKLKDERDELLDEIEEAPQTFRHWSD